jgi:hypothetical protein
MTVSKQSQDGTEYIWVISASGWLFKNKSITMHSNMNVCVCVCLCVCLCVCVFIYIYIYVLLFIEHNGDVSPEKKTFLHCCAH